MALTAQQAELVEVHMDLARAIARKWRHREWYWLTLDEAESQAYCTLCESALLFVPGRGTEFGAYAQAAIRNRLIDLLRRERRFAGRRPVPFSAIEADRDGHPWEPADPGGEDERMGWVREELAGLPKRDRQVVEMRLDGWRFREIAADCRCSKSTVTSLHRRSVQSMRRHARKGGMA